METRIAPVRNARAYYHKNRSKSRPTIRLQGDWLNEIGFTYGKLALAEHEKDRLIIRLRDEAGYKELVKDAYQTGSGLFQVRRAIILKNSFPRLDIHGFPLQRLGLTIGRIALARYEYGLISLSLAEASQLEQYYRGLGTRTKILKVSHAKAGHRRRPSIDFLGCWLDEIGFKCGKLVTTESENGQIILRLQESCQNLTQGRLKISSGPVQVAGKMKRHKYQPFINLKGFWLEGFGFTIGRTFTACYEYGLIKLLLTSPEQSQKTN